MRNMLWQMSERNKAERREGSIGNLKRGIRAGLQTQEPDLSDAEIEARVQRRIERGMRPTKDVLPPKPCALSNQLKLRERSKRKRRQVNKAEKHSRLARTLASLDNRR
jgi:hypothetical protein